MHETYVDARQIGARYQVHHLTPGCTRWKLSDIEAWEASKANAK